MTCSCFIPVGKFIIVFYERKINDLPVSKFGLSLPCDIDLVWGGQSFTRQGIHDMLEIYSVETALWARFMAFVWMILYTLVFPLMVIFYIFLFCITILFWLLLWPFFFFCREDEIGISIVHNLKVTGRAYVLYLIPNFLVMISFLLMSPIQFVSPELAKAMRFHMWTN